MAERKGVFISYATRDGAAFAAGLRSALESEGVFVWQDVIQLPRVVGQDWWKRITDGIDHVNYLIMVLTPAAFERETVLQEWRYARRTGVCVIPVKAAPEVDIQALPRWMRKVQFGHLGYTPTLEAFRAHDDGQSWKGLIGQIFAPCEKPDYAFMVDKNDVYVPRAALSGQVIEGLLDREQKAPRAITSALRGAGGFGKLTLARAICYDDRVQDAFSDGILWVTLGESATMDTVRVKLNALIEAKTHQRSDRDFESAKARLRELLDGQEVLIVIDDVWKREHAEPFLRLGDHLTYLITTRMDDVLPHTAQRIPIAGMALAEAAALIAYGFSDEDKQSHAGELRTLAEQLGEYALLLKLANGTLHDRVRAGEPLAKALDHLKRALEKRGITKAIQIANSDDRSRAVDATLRLSIERLSDRELEWFKRLAIFPEDAVIPFATLEKAWACDDLDVEDGCAALNRLSLVLNYDLNARMITLHDVVRAYLREQVMESADPLKTANAAFLDAFGIAHWRDLPPDAPYLWDTLAYHLLEAGRVDELVATVLDLHFPAKKTIIKGTPAVERDLEVADAHAAINNHPNAPAVTLLTRHYRNMSHILQRCATPLEILITLHERLSHLQALRHICISLEPEIKPFITQRYPLPDLPDPSLIRALSSHEGAVLHAMYSPDGKRIVSTSENGLVQIWDAETGTLLFSLSRTGSTGTPRSAVYSPDGRRIVSASEIQVEVWDAETGSFISSFTTDTLWPSIPSYSPDGKRIVIATENGAVRIWDAADSMPKFVLTGHTDVSTSAVYSPDGKSIASSSEDGTVRIWDSENGIELLTLSGHGGVVLQVTFSPDGTQIASVSEDNTVRIWDSETGAELLAFNGDASLRCIAYSPDARQLAGGAVDGLVMIWDIETGLPTISLVGHTRTVWSVAYRHDGERIVTASEDGTVRVWEFARETVSPQPTRFARRISSAAYSPDGRRMLSASEDKSLTIWDTESGSLVQTLNGHTRSIKSAVYSPDGERIVSVAEDRTVRVWDAETGKLVRILTGHTDGVRHAEFHPDGHRIVTASEDKTVRLWQASTGSHLRTLTGHTGGVTSVTCCPKGQNIVSSSRDKTLRVWDIETGVSVLNLVGHTDVVWKVVYSPNGQQIMSASWDGTIRLWDAHSGRLMQTIEGHTSSVNSAIFSKNGELIISVAQDATLRIWNAITADCLTTFYADAPLSCCALSPDGEHIVAGGDGGYLYWLRWVE